MDEESHCSFHFSRKEIGKTRFSSPIERRTSMCCAYEASVELSKRKRASGFSGSGQKARLKNGLEIYYSSPALHGPRAKRAGTD
ncbi:hypothetical protein MTR_2g007470 [Medicago truncatula]|uniref:Uncharacterized protein n=1 Tax=Medicago truncatula TaxID=3880 RepID=G7IJY2_MEDTR|nr:hypothetical protein MTR_2g007470 [Medicago truncatula]